LLPSPTRTRQLVPGSFASRFALRTRNEKRSLDFPGLANSAPPAAHNAMLEGLVEIRQARLARITLAGGVSAPLNWLAVIALGILTQIAVAIVQLDKLRPQALALFVFTTAFAATVALIGLGERPFSGRAINDSPLRAAIASAIR